MVGGPEPSMTVGSSSMVVGEKSFLETLTVWPRASSRIAKIDSVCGSPSGDPGHGRKPLAIAPSQEVNKSVNAVSSSKWGQRGP